MELKVEGLPEVAGQVKDTYDYLTGKRTHDLSGLRDATSQEVQSCEDLSKFVKFFDDVDEDLDIQIDSSKTKFLVTFSATEVPKSLADQIKPGGKYYDQIHSYDRSSKKVEMIFLNSKKESVMQPTPTPYKLELKTEGTGYDFVDRKSVKDSDGFSTDYSWYKSTDGLNVFVFGDSDFYGPDDKEFDFETESDEEAQQWFDEYNGFEESEDDIFESLIETAGLDTSVLVRKVNDDGVDSIEMDINGRVYSFIMKKDSPYSIDDMFHKVTKMRHYSEGRALQFMKKNMIGKRVESVLRESLLKEEFTDKKTITLTVNDSEGQIESLISHIKETAGTGHSFTVRVDSEGSDYYKEFWIDGDGSDHILDIKSEPLKEGKNPFKDKHICDGCGKSLSQCTCEVSEEDMDLDETLSEKSQSFSKGDWVVINIEPRLSGFARLVPVKVESSSEKTFRGWAWSERQYEYHKSSVLYVAKSEEDALRFIKANRGKKTSEIRKNCAESLSEGFDFTECEVNFYNPSSGDPDTLIVTADDETDAIEVAYERISSEYGMSRDNYDEEFGPINHVDVNPLYSNEESLRESSVFSGDAYLEPGTLVDFGPYGSLYVVQDHGDCWRVSYNKDGSGKTWYMKKYLGQGVIEDPLVPQKNDPDAPYEVLSISTNDKGEVEAQCVDFIDGEDFEKWLGDPSSSTGKNNAHKLLRDYSYYIDNKLRSEIVSTFGLKEEFGQSSATQSGSVGHYKKGSLDMFPESREEEEE